MIKLLAKLKKLKWLSTPIKLTLRDFQYQYSEINEKSIEKKIFILGAGFSYSAGVPTQVSLLSKIINHDNTFDPSFETKKIQVLDFIADIFPDIMNVDIEDVFTILDRGVNEKERFLTYSWQNLYELRSNLIYIILFIIDEALREVDYTQINAYSKFVKHLVKFRKSNHHDLTIVSTNWDNLLEKYLNNFIQNDSDVKTDYCIYTYRINDLNHIPDITLNAKGYQNIKILKLHGSINWLYCSQCKRIYIDDSSISLTEKQCEYCISSETDGSHLSIEPMIITPTLLKEYHNLYIQGIWQNAFIELQEAKKIYFIGYSLPKIDFELKYLLKKSIRNLEINVILAPSDEDNEAHKNYQRLFGDENVTYHFNGFESWVNTLEDG